MLIRIPDKDVEPGKIASDNHTCEVTGFHDKFNWDFSKAREFFQFRSKSLMDILVKKNDKKNTISRALTIETSGVRTITVHSLEDRKDRIPLIKPWRGENCKITLDGTWLAKAASQSDVVRLIPNILSIEGKKYRVWGIEAGDVQMAVAEILPKEGTSS